MIFSALVGVLRPMERILVSRSGIGHRRITHQLLCFRGILGHVFLFI